MIISRQDILEVRIMGDYALVVREEYWDQQLRIFTQLRGIKLDKQQVGRIVIVVDDFAKRVGEALRRLTEILHECFENVWIFVKDSVSDTIGALKEFFDECDIAFDDDFYTICDKIENRMLYLNRQEYIRNERYYKSQFKLAKMNYNIMHHDRRC